VAEPHTLFFCRHLLDFRRPIGYNIGLFFDNLQQRRCHDFDEFFIARLHAGVTD